MSKTIRAIVISVLGVAGLAGCEEYDLRATNASYLEPLEQQGMFRWKTIGDPVYPVDSEVAEQARMRQLGEVLRLNAACVDGYDVISRHATIKRESPWGGIYDVFYTVRCR